MKLGPKLEGVPVEDMVMESKSTGGVRRECAIAPSILFERFPEVEGSQLTYNKFISMDRIRHCGWKYCSAC